jgi:hypothetical protein
VPALIRHGVEFRRAAGEASASQRWIDANLPICPLCKSPSLWETSAVVDQLALKRWVFRCPNCKVVLSTIPDITVSALSPPVTVIKTPITKDVRVESVARSGDEDFVGEEFPLSELQEWATEE